MASEKQIGERNRSFCYMRSLATLAVVVLHVCQYNTEVFFPTGKDKIISVVIRNATFWAVPVFVMVTGALMLNPVRRLSYKRLLRHYVIRILVLLYLCICAQILLDQYVLGIEERERWISLWRHSVRELILAGGWTPMWYLYLLPAIYLVLPAFRLMVQAANKYDLLYLISVLFVFQSVLPMVVALTVRNSKFYILYYTIYPLYLLLGYVLSLINRTDRVTVRVVAMEVAFCFVLNAVLTCSCFLNGWLEVIRQIGTYSFPLTVIQASGIFFLFSQSNGTRLSETGLSGECAYLPDGGADEEGLRLTDGETDEEGMFASTAGSEGESVQPSADGAGGRCMRKLNSAGAEEESVRRKVGRVVSAILLHIDRHTLKIYIIHLFLLRVLLYGIGFDPYQYGIGMVLTEALVLYLGSYAIAELWQRFIDVTFRSRTFIKRIG